jgi:dephospho-CoA kinase
MSEGINPRIIGLTGGIGSGKTAAAECFAGLGATVVDTDAIAHDLTGPGGDVMAAIGEEFGKTVIAADGRLDRAAMRRLAFADPEARRRLEAILHPLIRVQAEYHCREALALGAPYVILVVPLLVETDGYRDLLTHVLVIDCDDEIRITRVAARSGLSREEILRIIDAQASRVARLAAATEVIDNSGSRNDLCRQVAERHRHYLDEIKKLRYQGRIGRYFWQNH